MRTYRVRVHEHMPMYICKLKWIRQEGLVNGQKTEGIHFGTLYVPRPYRPNGFENSSVASWFKSCISSVDLDFLFFLIFNPKELKEKQTCPISNAKPLINQLASKSKSTWNGCLGTWARWNFGSPNGGLRIALRTTSPSVDVRLQEFQRSIPALKLGRLLRTSRWWLSNEP